MLRQFQIAITKVMHKVILTEVPEQIGEVKKNDK